MQEVMWEDAWCLSFVCAATEQPNLIWFFVIYSLARRRENKHKDNGCINHRRTSGGHTLNLAINPRCAPKCLQSRGTDGMCQHQFQLNNCEPFPSCAPLPHNELLALLEPHGRWSARVHAQSSRNMQAWFRRATPFGWALTALPGPITLLRAWGMQAACGKISHAFWLARPTPREAPAVPGRVCALWLREPLNCRLLCLCFLQTFTLTIKAPWHILHERTENWQRPHLHNQSQNVP